MRYHDSSSLNSTKTNELHQNIELLINKLIIKHNITHIINYNTNHFSDYLIDFFRKSRDLKISAYYNDCPFSTHYSKLIYYRNQKKVFSKYDYIFVYRKEDKDRIIHNYHVNNSLIKVVPPSCPENKYLKIINPPSKYLYDFAFVGHYETDGRLYVVRQLLRMGYRCLVVGLKWPEKILRFSNTNNSKIEKRYLIETDLLLSILNLRKVNSNTHIFYKK